MAKVANNIVLACETENARSLVDCIDQALTEKLVDIVDEKKRVMGAELLGENVADINSGDWQDRYESYELGIQEAIDEVVEAVEKGEDIEECIDRTATNRKIDKAKLKEYFNSMLESNSVEVDSTKETSAKSLKNAERMDDEDVSKRIRFESKEVQGSASDLMECIVSLKAVVLDSDNSYIEITEQQATALKAVFNNLNEENQELMMEKLTSDRSGFVQMVNWCLQATK